MISRRSFMRAAGIGGVAGATPFAGLGTEVGAPQQRAGGTQSAGVLPPSIASLKSMRDQAQPITLDERRARLEQARRLMAENNLDALMLMGGTSLTYFSNVRWGGR